MTIDIASGKYRFFTRGNNNTLYSAAATVGPNDSWQHIVAVYDQSDPSSPELRIYINGELSDSSPGRPQGLRVSSSPVSIGSKRLGNSPGYDGSFGSREPQRPRQPTSVQACRQRSAKIPPDCTKKQAPERSTISAFGAAH